MQNSNKKESENFKKKINEIMTADEINTLIEEKAYSHTYYYHYSDCDAIKSIIENKNFWISPVCFSNDATEHNRFGDETYRYFQLCFSTGTTENLPLWLLYSKSERKGARISFKRADIRKLCDLENMKLKLVNALNSEVVAELVNGSNCKIQFKDVLYRKKEADKYRLKYNTGVNNNFPADEMLKIESENKGFLKDIVWYYEKETRILVKVDSTLIDKKLFVDAEKSPYRVELTIPDECYKNIDIMFSPVYYNDKEKIEAELNDKAFMALNCSKALSEYAGQIEIDLCKDCTKKCVRKGETKVCLNT